MGKKFLPVIVKEVQYKLYLEDLTKIYKKIEKIERIIPAYNSRPTGFILRKRTIETQPDTEGSTLDPEEDSFHI